ncbi:hypothetical protein [Variovorax sp. Sphag1AA]|uniref:hypothetical protein n=1 Tax=Variovorax sp. Sphag1AA TaxID=2587027 RepID=UPI001611A032|nr:hypothetical protein [Variovorax sp. Sphag1AA]MBB3181210.1 hypothetical protein [Variovorax sp. Sphag1AA]
MLTVRNLPPEPTFRDWLQENTQLLVALGAWALTMLAISGSVPQGVASSWHVVRFVEGAAIYDQTQSESDCDVTEASGDGICLSGPGL